MSSEAIIVATHATPAGTLVLGAWHDALCLCDWASSPHHSHNILRMQRALKTTVQTGEAPLLTVTQRQLNEYFTGSRHVFTLPLCLTGSDFQNSVWRTLLAIPYGTTCFYAAVAHQLLRPTAVRSVANAVGANPLSILVPCHRVIGTHGGLTGYAGGLPAKHWLLQLEGSLPPTLFR